MVMALVKRYSSTASVAHRVGRVWQTGMNPYQEKTWGGSKAMRDFAKLLPHSTLFAY